MKYTLGIDLGGTNIAAGLVDESMTIIDRETIKTRPPRPAQEIARDIAGLCRQLVERRGIAFSDVAWVGIGTPGVIWNGVICLSTNLALRDAPMAELVAAELDAPVYLANDANAAAYGEYMTGEERGCHSLAIMTIGTGIGGGIIMDGRILEGFNGAGAELGHTILHPGGRECSCGKLGCVEAYCSANSLLALTKEAMQVSPDSAMWGLCGGDLEKVSAKTPFQAMRGGDPAAVKVVERYLDDLAIATANIINLLQPEVFCIGGGVSREGDGIILPLRERVQRQTFAGREGLRTKIVAAGLGNDAGILGAAMLGSVGGASPIR